MVASNSNDYHQKRGERQVAKETKIPYQQAAPFRAMKGGRNGLTQYGQQRRFYAWR
jgi:hypothetical protein